MPPNRSEKQLQNSRTYAHICIVGGLAFLILFWRGGYPGGAPPLDSVGGVVWLNVLLVILGVTALAVLVPVWLSERLSPRLVRCGLILSFVALASEILAAAVRCASVLDVMGVAFVLMYGLLIIGTLLGTRNLWLLLKNIHGRN